VVGYTLLLSLIEYKTAVMRDDMEAAAQILGTIPKVTPPPPLVYPSPPHRRTSSPVLSTYTPEALIAVGECWSPWDLAVSRVLLGGILCGLCLSFMKPLLIMKPGRMW
jgi:hypothetical protein